MRRISLLLTAVIFSITALQAQTSDRANTQQEVKAYLEKNVYPKLEKQQKAYFDKLTKEEQETISKLRNERPQQRPQQRANKGDRKPNDCTDEVKQITAKYPKLNKAYADFIDENKDKWTNDIDAIHEKNNIEPVNNRQGRAGYGELIRKVSQPEFLLLWDSERPIFNRQSNGRNQRSERMGNKGNRNGNYRNGNFSPEKRAEVEAYAQKNIFPVISAERMQMDKELSAQEKQTIADARVEFAKRKAEVAKWQESDDFVPGERANDPAYDEQRKEMRNKMEKVRDIAQVHRTELYASLDKIRENSDSWQEDIRELTGNDCNKGRRGHRSARGNNYQRITPIAFLLFDSENPDASTFLRMNKGMRR